MTCIVGLLSGGDVFIGGDSAGIASAHFTVRFLYEGEIAVFDSRVFNIPKEEVCNYFIWRQMDWTRNSVEMLARAHFSHSEYIFIYSSNSSEFL